jgi:hypothetical protein
LKCHCRADKEAKQEEKLLVKQLKKNKREKEKEKKRMDLELQKEKRQTVCSILSPFPLVQTVVVCFICLWKWEQSFLGHIIHLI